MTAVVASYDLTVQRNGRTLSGQGGKSTRMDKTRLEPKLWTLLREGYSRRLFFHDLSAGTIVGIVALPLAIAFAIASGVKPEQGLFTAIIGGFIISALSGSRVQIGGPTGAFIILIYSVVQKYGYDGLAVATIMAGALLVIMGLARFGAVISYIPYPVTVGFTSAIAVIIFVGQCPDFLGLQTAESPVGLVHKLQVSLAGLHTFNPWSLLLGMTAVTVIVLSSRFLKLMPGSLLAVLLTSILAAVFHLPVETIGTRFGEISGSLPAPRIPWSGFARWGELLSPAISIALLAGIESLLSAVVADGMTGRRHRSNMELVAQGAANIASPLFGGIPVTGAIARTATNIRSGARTPVAGLVHALVLLLILVLLGRWAAYIPMTALAAVLMVVAFNMSEYRMFVRLLRSPKGDVLVLLLTFSLTLLVDLTVAIQAGVVLASLLFMHRMVEVSQVSSLNRLADPEEESPDEFSILHRMVPDGVEVFEINGPFFFGAAEKFRLALKEVNSRPEVLIIRMRNVSFMDATGLRALDNVCRESTRAGTLVLLSGVQPQIFRTLEKDGFLEHLGAENIYPNIDMALARAWRQIQKETEPETRVNAA